MDGDDTSLQGEAVWYSAGSRLLDDLPKLMTTALGNIDFKASDREVVARICADAESTLFVIHQGIRAIGLLMCDYTPVSGERALRDETINGLGTLLAYFGDIGASLEVTAAFARHAMACVAPIAAETPQAPA